MLTFLLLCFIINYKMARRKKKVSPKVKTLNLVHWIGRFGNRMFQVAFGKTYELRFGVEFRAVSKWEGDFVFQNCKTKLIPEDDLRNELTRYGSSHSGQTLDGWKDIIKKHNERVGDDLSFLFPYDQPQWGRTNVCLDCSCWDSNFLFKQYSKKELKHFFEFSDELKASDIYKRAEDKQGTYDIAHLRRDDIMYSDTNHNWNYPAISKRSYEKAFYTFGVDPKKVVWISDDFPTYPSQGWAYPTGQNFLLKEPFYDFLPDFLKLYFARKIFRANSSFSWWASFLSPIAKVYSPILHKRIIYSEEQEELNCEFIEGTTPHFMHILGYAFGEPHDMEGFHSCPFINIPE